MDFYSVSSSFALGLEKQSSSMPVMVTAEAEIPQMNVICERRWCFILKSFSEYAMKKYSICSN